MPGDDRRPSPDALRPAAALRAVGLPLVPDGMTWCFDRTLARQVAAVVRADLRHRGLIVPSLAFPDEPTRCNVVLFADRFAAPFRHLLLGWEEVVRVEGGTGRDASRRPRSRG